jgi:formylglycine-generating enzyme required for sulfatase activity
MAHYVFISHATKAVTAADAPSSTEKREVSVDAPQKQEVSTAGKAPSTPVNRGRKLVFAGALVALLTAGVLRADADAEKAQPAKEEGAKKKEDSLKAVAAATKEQPYVNSLGMKFVPVPGTAVLFSIWETRVKDYKVFVEAKNREWPKPGFPQTEEHPAVNVSWEDATAFCEWLTEQERTAGRISVKQSYRLPSDEEWSAAVGLEKESGSTPATRDMKVKGIYPWGTKWPPPKGAGNYDTSLKVDDYEYTSPAGSFAANRFGIHDLGGNVWEWCQDWYEAEKIYRVLRGASWSGSNPDLLLSSCRFDSAPERRSGRNGFRCVLVVESSR